MIFKSKGEAKKMITNGAIYINQEKIIDVHKIITTDDLIGGKYILIGVGKKKHYLYKFE